MPNFRETSMLTFDSLQKRAFDNDNDADAKFMWQALIVATSAPGYTHLTPEEVFEYLRTGTTPFSKGIHPFVILAQSDNICDYVRDAAICYDVDVNRIEKVIANYILDGYFTIVFDLNGKEPWMLPNTEKNGNEKTLRSCDCPHSDCS